MSGLIAVSDICIWLLVYYTRCTVTWISLNRFSLRNHIANWSRPILVTVPRGCVKHDGWDASLLSHVLETIRVN